MKEKLTFELYDDGQLTGQLTIVKTKYGDMEITAFDDNGKRENAVLMSPNCLCNKLFNKEA